MFNDLLFSCFSTYNYVVLVYNMIVFYQPIRKSERILFFIRFAFDKSVHSTPHCSTTNTCTYLCIICFQWLWMCFDCRGMLHDIFATNKQVYCRKCRQADICVSHGCTARNALGERNREEFCTLRYASNYFFLFIFKCLVHYWYRVQLNLFVLYIIPYNFILIIRGRIALSMRVNCVYLYYFYLKYSIYWCDNIEIIY